MRLMTIDKEGIEFIKKFEGCKLTAYKPVSSEKYWTIGFGHYGKDVTQGMTITMERAEQLFRDDIKPIERSIHKLGKCLTQGEYNTLVSWIYNLGNGNFDSSTLKKKILAEAEDEEITDQIVRWIYAGGKPLLGLKRRRVAEANMWLEKERYYIDASGAIKKK